MRKQEPSSNEMHDMKISPKFNNNLLGNGNNAHRAGNGSVFDHQDEALNHKINSKGVKGSIDPADVLVENEMLRSELQKMKEKMAQMEKVSLVSLADYSYI